MIDYSYTLTTRPAQLFVRITYSKDGSDDVVRNITGVTDFSDEGLEALVSRYEPSVIALWEQMENVSDEAEREISGVKSAKQVVNEPVPSHDPSTHKVEKSTVETDDEIRHTFVVVPLTEEELKTVSASEARQYLHQTDWVTAKLAESAAGVISEDVQSAYSDVFAKRAEARELINRIEG